MRDVKKNSPEKKCKLVYDRLLVEDKVFVFRCLTLNLNIIIEPFSSFSVKVKEELLKT